MSGPGKRGKAPRVNVMKSHGLGVSPVRRDAVFEQASASAFAVTQLSEDELDSTVFAPAPSASDQEADTDQAAVPTAASPAGPITARQVVDRLRAERLEHVSLTYVRDASNQPRRWYDPKSLTELANDIRQRGLFQPVVLRTLTGRELEAEVARGSGIRYELVFGHRRLRAFQQLASDSDPVVAARFATLPAFVARPDEMTALEARLLTAAENRQRDDLSPIELARDVVSVRDALEAGGQASADFDLAVFYGMVPEPTLDVGHSRLASRKAPGIISEYRRIGETITDAVLLAAGVTTRAAGGTETIDWEVAAGLRKGELYRVAKLQSESSRIEALRKLAARLREERAPRHRGARDGDGDGAYRFSYYGLRTEGEFYMRLTKPVAPDSYSVAEGRRYLGDVEPLVALLAEISGQGGVVYRPERPNMPGTYLLLTKPPADLTDDERQSALKALETLAAELRGAER